MTRLVLKYSQAERDIEECFVFIAENNLDAGIKFLVAIEDSLDQLAEFPLLGKPLELKNEQLSNARVWRVKGYQNYLIFYSLIDNEIQVIRLLQSSRDIEGLFE